MLDKKRRRLPFADSAVLKSVFDRLGIGVLICDQNGRLRWFNREAEKILGAAPLGGAPDSLSSADGWYLPDQKTPYPPGGTPLARAAHGEGIQGELVFLRNQRWPDGVWISASSRPYGDGRGATRGTAVILRNVTAAMTTLKGGPDHNHLPVLPEGELLERFDQLRTYFDRFVRVVEQTADGVMITNRSGVIEYVNPAFERITGYRTEEVLGESPGILKSGRHNRRFYGQMWNRLLRGRSFRGTLINKRKSGGLFLAEQTITPIRDSSGKITHFVSLFRDVTEERARREQMFHLAMAAKTQRRFYDLSEPCDGLDLAAAVYPASTVGGDHVDLVMQPDGEAWVVVGDVSGHGFGSALFMAETRAYLRAFATAERDFGRLLGMVNRALVADLDESSFVTLMLVAVDSRRLEFRYASAGHVTGFLIHRSGDAVRTLDSTDPPLGLFSDHLFASGASGQLSPGDIFVLLTDGVTEVSDDNGWWVVDHVRSHLGLEARELVEGICTLARERGDQKQTDDCTAVVCRVIHPPGEANRRTGG